MDPYTLHEFVGGPHRPTLLYLSYGDDFIGSFHEIFEHRVVLYYRSLMFFNFEHRVVLYYRAFMFFSFLI